MRKLFLLIPFLAILSACQPPMTREQELAIYRSRCLDYGFPMGTADFARCMQAQETLEAELTMKARKLQVIEEQNQMQWRNLETMRIQQNEFDRKRKKHQKDKKHKR